MVSGEWWWRTTIPSLEPDHFGLAIKLESGLERGRPRTFDEGADECFVPAFFSSMAFFPSAFEVVVMATFLDTRFLGEDSWPAIANTSKFQSRTLWRFGPLLKKFAHLKM